MTPHRWGCCECEWERLRKWAIENKLIDYHTGPADMVDTILRLVAKMERRIQADANTIEALRARKELA